MNRGSHKHLNFLEYKINVHSLFLSHRETALKNNKLQEFLQAWMPVKEILEILYRNSLTGGLALGLYFILYVEFEGFWNLETLFLNSSVYNK